MEGYFTDDTICALATPQGHGGISVIRMSGKDSLAILRKLCPKLIKDIKSHTLHLTNFYDISNSTVLDEVVVAYFAKGKSFTGEESVEISCHGSPVVVNELLQNLISSGARSAKRGEFTYRAFMNQRIDLAQAESVLSLIESQSKQAARISLRQLKGDLSKQVAVLEEKIVFVLANLEASIDFSTEDIDVLDYDKCLLFLNEIEQKTSQILSTYNAGRIIKEGFHISIVGRPNAGKSSLLNAICSQEKAIVSDIPGTTRDVVEAELSLGGILVKLSDTAGIHETSDKVERLGIEKSKRAMEEADHLFVVLSPEDVSIPEDVQPYLKEQNYSLLFSKSDTGKSAKPNTLIKPLSQIAYSAVSGDGVSKILDLIESILKESYSYDSAVVFQSRHFELFTIIKDSVQRAKKLFIEKASQEFIAVELQQAIVSLHEILGKRFDDEVMDRVFREFCIGK
ncbi:MAG: tRNA uridine-5-carboxymethylaminomethyl(34) synthesis GTPase MnmE [Bdellovibrionales bacterium]|nr:tRNA uridine-5-carboxymethylaminomethyl(34) synthesis GTPase MnmE [Bdellovibrionales bacterium]